MNYVCSCDCEHDDTTIKYEYRKDIKFNGRHRKVRFCPDHPDGLAVSKFIYCEDCGARRDFKYRGGQRPLFCEACQAAKVKEKKRIVSNEYYYRTAERIPTGVPFDILMMARKTIFDDLKNTGEQWDCKNRTECLDIYDRFDAMPCPKCEFYQSKFFQDVFLKQA